MSIAIYPTKSRSEDQPLRFDGGSHKTRQEMKTALKKHSQGSEKEAYIGGEFKRRKDTWRCQNSGRVLCLRHSSICFRKNKILCLNIQNYLLLTFVFHFLLFLLYLFFFFSIFTDPQWKTDDFQYQEKWCRNVYLCWNQYGGGKRQWSSRADCLW